MKRRLRWLWDTLRTHEWTVLAAVYFMAAIVADVYSGPKDNLSDFYVVVPVLLALEWGWVVVSLATVPLVLASATNVFGVDSLSWTSVTVRAIGVGIGGVVGVYVSVTRERRAARLARTQVVAEAAQGAILPVIPDRIGAYRFSALYRSASEEALVGGDFYSVVTTQFGVRVLIGDVQGKGVEAVQLSAAVMGCFREWAPETAKLRTLVAKLEDRVITTAPRGEFVTAIVATLEDELAVEIANCGHPSPVLLSGAGARDLDPTHRTVPLGLSADPVIERHQLHEGDRVLFYTDGLIEARDRSGQFILIDKLLRTVRTDRFESALDDLLAQVEARAGRRLRDDSATLLIECGAPLAPEPALLGSAIQADPVTP